MTSTLSQCAVYTTIDPQRVFAAARGDKPSEVLYEKKRWVTALKLFQEAKRKGEKFPLFLSDSCDCESLVFWAQMHEMRVAEDGTYFRFSRLMGLRDRSTQDLVLLKDKRNIAPGFIRPYALVETPDFLDAQSMDAEERFRETQGEAVAADEAEDRDVAPVLSSARFDFWGASSAKAPDGASPKQSGAGTARPCTPVARVQPSTVVPTLDERVLTLFSWGYYGWGSSLPQLLSITEAAERSRGFSAPVFVDVRFNRSVRAAGFREHAFERALPLDRHEWMKGLGNEEVAAGGLKIHRPVAALDLLDRALREHQRRRRVIFFCSCDTPAECHRNEVRKLLLKEARKRGLEARVVEWPGGAPAREHSLSLSMDPKVFNKVVRDAPSIPIDVDLALGPCASLPWGSYVDITCGDRRVTVAVGPARFSAGRWFLPRFIGPIEEGDTIDHLADAVGRVRESDNYVAFET